MFTISELVEQSHTFAKTFINVVPKELKTPFESFEGARYSMASSIATQMDKMFEPTLKAFR